MFFRTLVAGLLLTGAAHAQTAPAGDTVRLRGQLFTYVEQMPQPPGGTEGMLQFLGTHLHYPAEALQQRLEGRVFVGFVVSETGALEQIRVLKGVHPLLDAEAVRVFQLMPAWTPGKQVGRPVRVAYTTPVTFRLPPPAAAPAGPEPPKYPFDVAAQYPGGMERLHRDVARALRATAREEAEHAKGRLFVQFLVDAAGQVQDVSVTRGLAPQLDAAVVRVLRQLRPWKPAQYQGQPVPMSFTLPLTFGPDAP